MEDNILDLTLTHPFVDSEWIGLGKTFPADPPQFILDARDKMLAIPEPFQDRIPPNGTPIMHLLAWALPRQNETILQVSATKWFSPDSPHTTPQCLLTRDIPSRRCLEELSKQFGQAWFDGAKSIIDPRYNNGRDRIPLWAITYWKQVAGIQSIKAKWSDAREWLERQKKKTLQRELDTFGAYIAAEQRLTLVPWRSVLPYLRGTVPTTELVAYLGEDWLSDDNLNMMMVQLSQDLVVAGGKQQTLIASLGVAKEILTNGPEGRYPIKCQDHRGAPLLCRYQKCIKENDIKKLYFPANVGNHWIACCIDFETREVSYGDSNRTHSPMTDVLVAHTCTWLKVCFGFDAKVRGNSLPHAVQFDSFSCGMIAVNTIEHNTLDRELWTAKKANYHRVKWFNRLTAFLASPPVSVTKSVQRTCSVSAELVSDSYLSVLLSIGDHNFPDLEEFILAGMKHVKGSKSRKLAEAKTAQSAPTTIPPSPSVQILTANQTQKRSPPAKAKNSLFPSTDPAPPSTNPRPPSTNPAPHESTDPTIEAVFKLVPLIPELPRPTVTSFGSIPSEPGALDVPSPPVDLSAKSNSKPSLPESTRPHTIEASSNEDVDIISHLDVLAPMEPMDCSDETITEVSQIGTGRKRKKVSILDGLSEDESDSDGFESDDSIVQIKARSVSKGKAVGAEKGRSKPKKPIAGSQSRDVKRQRIEEETEAVDPERQEKWKKELQNDDPHVWVDPLNPRRIRHSKCTKPFLVKHLYDKTRWNSHLKACKKRREKMKLKSKGLSQPLISSHIPSWDLGSQTTTQHTNPQVKPSPPCPGLRQKDHPRIPVYLGRVFARTAGGIAIDKLPGERFEGKFADLPESERERLRLAQTHTHRWRNEPRHGAVFSITCQKLASNASGAPCLECKAILKFHTFQNALAKEPPPPENRKFTNNVNRDPVLGKLYVDVLGFKELIDAPDGKDNIYVRFVQGVLSGKYNNKVLTGMVQAFMTKEDRLEEGKGMQNFPWAPEYDEFCYLAHIISPQLYRLLSDTVPVPAARTHRRRDAQQPPFPQEIGDEMFEQVLEYFNAIGYHGPCSLSCDDTKLLGAYRPYFDSKTKKHYLVGGVDGPVEVLDHEAMDELLDELRNKKAVKVRVFCLSIPIRKVPPIIVAALPIPDNLKVDDLYPLSERILKGLLSRGIDIISYACDGTETERKVQRQFVANAKSHSEYKIASPFPGGADINIKIPLIDGHPVAQIQDSRHALKTLRNNLYSGARLLVLGDFVAQYSHILQIAKDSDSPIYLRDVEKLDRQDDNAATRLFSAETLRYVCDRHESFKAEIPYLFIFGELIDAYQNRSISHIERVEMVLRAHYFLDGWLKALELSSHSKTKHTLSREALDILRFIINGFLELVFIHRDHISSPTPLLPWLHSSEVCEHVFGEARRIVKDFTFLDFISMIPKLRVKIRQDIFKSRTSDPKARASGYAHTYFNYGDDNEFALMQFPSDSAIAQAAQVAADQADSLLAFLGLKPQMLRSLVHTPGIRLHLSSTQIMEGVAEDEESDGESESESEDPIEASEVFSLIQQEGGKVRLESAQNEILDLSSASLALVVGDMEKIHSMCTDDEVQNLANKDFGEVQSTLNRLSVMASNVPSKPLGQLAASSPFSNVDFQGLVETRINHQTHEAATGIRTKGKNLDTETQSELSERQKAIKHIHEKLKVFNTDKGVGTGLERNTRWKNGKSSTAPTGNAANAATVAKTNASKASQKRRKIFTSQKVPESERLSTAGVTKVRKLAADGADYAFVLANDKIVVGRVIGLQNKSATKNVRHQAATVVENISSTSYISIQVFEPLYGNRFTALTSRTTLVGTNQFEHLSPPHVLCVLTSKPRVLSPRDIELGNEDLKVFTSLCGGINALKLAVAAFRKRGNQVDEDEE